MNPARWTPEQVAELVRLYPTTRPEAVAQLIGRPLKSVYDKAAKLGIRCLCPQASKTAAKVGSKPCLPSVRVRAPVRGPAYLDGPLVFTDKTRRVVGPAMPQPTRSNTHNTF